VVADAEPVEKWEDVIVWEEVKWVESVGPNVPRNQKLAENVQLNAHKKESKVFINYKNFL
jgi:hypothetical protein